MSIVQDLQVKTELIAVTTAKTSYNLRVLVEENIIDRNAVTFKYWPRGGNEKFTEKFVDAPGAATRKFNELRETELQELTITGSTLHGGRRYQAGIARDSATVKFVADFRNRPSTLEAERVIQSIRLLTGVEVVEDGHLEEFLVRNGFDRT